MRERLIEDWLTRINERGYELPFCQTLLSQGYQILRCGHSPVEHGKDILALAPDGGVCAYQLKTGDFGQAELNSHHAQIAMLVETRPTHSGLPSSFDYRPFFVTTGEFKDPAISLIRELNNGWKHRHLPTLSTIGGKQLLADFIKLSADFWPIKAPDVRRFRELYLVDGRGDFDINQFAKFITEILKVSTSGLSLDRRAAAANLFTSYLLGDFYTHGDNWSITRGWTICAAQIAWAGQSGKHPDKYWKDAYEIAKTAAYVSLESLANETFLESAFEVRDRELDEYTRTRNTCALAAATCWQLINSLSGDGTQKLQETVNLLKNFFANGRLYFWGEGALSQFLMFIWILDRKDQEIADTLLLELIGGIAKNNAKESQEFYEDPYNSPDECLTKLFQRIDAAESPRRIAVESYSLLPMIALAVRRDLREQLEIRWKAITDVALTWFRPDTAEDVLLWHCDKGREYSQTFARPQSWRELRDWAFKIDPEIVPPNLKDDIGFALLFLLVYQHRTSLSLIKTLDGAFCSRARMETSPNTHIS